ncbi:hypothetical protein ACHHYP_11098 [Achlya hypogyna]|uniref:Chromo domain-containing protein n=1 Tax=Achlya hypogyna TaxID=1202772 RepID=A0A1V9YJZ6_ACHHY|nr:hypothetical protein ACHHYP_11098 [Achlya hypogyna]
MKANYDKGRLDVTFQVGDLVYLDCRDIHTGHAQSIGVNGERSRPKLAPHNIGPFEIVENVNPNAMRLNLPPNMSQLHNVFNVDGLSFVKANTFKFSTRPIPKAAPVANDAEGHRGFTIVAFLDSRPNHGKKEYLVHWEGESQVEATWEPEDAVCHVTHFDLLLASLAHRQVAQASPRRRSTLLPVSLWQLAPAPAPRAS